MRIHNNPHGAPQNIHKQKTQRKTFHEFVVVCVWIWVGALTLWGVDGLGLLSDTTPYPSNSTRQVDFPAVHLIWKKGDAIFVDTRSAASFKRGHIPRAVNVPINRVKSTISELPTNKETYLITYCGSVECPNAYQLMNMLLGQGYINVKFFPRGLRGWHALGYPLETE
ncbi:hypothetical protein C6497_13130 [Candidatus Poribacteria bacterium]|nr:MAG: hypothetical protein C6497_13130 [Candidatus Poribacteria bacterium]